ncbi:hypothetical protein MMC26_006393 [Xylographa opegraphella]|nr:hypothetical protein [Xylographa opegraphella]
MSQYKPTEHDGLKQDGTPDKRVGTGEFAHGQVDPHEAGKAGGQTSGSSGEQYKPSENDGLKKDGTEDGRVGTGGTWLSLSFRIWRRVEGMLIPETEFAHGKVDPVEAGKAGGKSS